MIAARSGRYQRAEWHWKKALDSATLYGLKFHQGIILKEWERMSSSETSRWVKTSCARRSRTFQSMRAKFELREINTILERSGVFIDFDQPVTKHEASSTRTTSSASIGRRSSGVAREWDAVLKVGLASVSSSDPKDQINSILGEVVQLLAADKGILFVLDKMSGELHFGGGRNSAKESLARATAYSSAAVKQAWSSAELVLINGNDSSSLPTESVVANDLKSVIAVPLKVREVLTGVLYLDSSITNGLFSTEDADILMMISSHLAIAIESSQLASIEAARREMLKDLEVKQAVQTILDNLDQGFMAFDAEGRILPGVSKSAEFIFETDPVGKSVTELLKLSGPSAESVQRWIPMLFAEQIPFDSLVPLGPKTFEPGHKRFIALDFRPIRVADGRIEKVILIATDRSAEKELQDRAEAEANYAKMVISVLKDKPRFVGFVRLVRETVKDLEQRIESGNAAIDFSSALRNVHTVKGGAAMYHILELKNIAHELESLIAKVAASVASERSITDEVSKILSGTMKIREALNEFLSKNKAILGQFNEGEALERPVSVSELEWIGDRLQKAYGAESMESRRFFENCMSETIGRSFERYSAVVSQVASRQRKNANLIIEESPIRILPEVYGPLFDSFIHAFRNAVDHGIETADERLKQGKDRNGKIKVSFQKIGAGAGERIRISVADDGQGMDPARIGQLAVERGLKTVPQVQAMSSNEVLQLVFTSGFSTKDDVNDISGRGVGLDAIFIEAKKLNGNAWVESEHGKGSVLFVEVPILTTPMLVTKRSA